MFSYIWNTEDKISRDSVNRALPSVKVTKIVPLLWREHCMECAMLLCYSTCPLYEKRVDGRCARFARGTTPIALDELPIKGARIEFRRWAKLQAMLPHAFHAVDVRKYVAMTKRTECVGHVVRRICDAIGHYRLAQIVVSLLERQLSKKTHKEIINPDGFLAVIKNDESVPKELMLEILQGSHSVYKTKFDLSQGWNEAYIPLHQITLPSNEAKKWWIRAYLNPDETAVLTFAYFDLVSVEKNKSAKPASKVKCVAWDLDNTLWKGIIGDDGADNVHVNQDALTLIRQLDERGILQTIASKNNHDIAWAKIVELGLEDMFLYPAINWEQKSKNIQYVADMLNIGVDTFALIDDSSFEREEVSAALPEVRVYDAADISTLLNNPEFDVPVSEESKLRRQSYLNEAKRKKFSANYGGTDDDYISFLRACGMEMSIFTPVSDVDKTRCLELLLRSNQYNVSGNRYNHDEFQQFLASPDYRCLAFRVKDRFGDYGIVGFASFYTDMHDMSLKDFVMSCRVAMKHVERAFLYAVVNSPLFADCERLKIEVIKTSRNTPLREQLLQMPFRIEHEDNSKLQLALDKSVTFKDEGILKTVIL